MPHSPEEIRNIFKHFSRNVGNYGPKEKRVKFIFAWYDLWIGFFWDRKKKWFYIFPVPMFGLIIKFKVNGKK